MANKSAIKCNAGKTFLLDPNLLFGQEIDENTFVTPEDLNIFVELTTSRKNRSILDLTDDGLEATSTDVGKSRVSFIDGAENGKIGKDGELKKSLTTSYTELTTVFNKTADTEKFGIASIDIDFNSAYAPLIHIEFIDVRGASLFNTGNPPKSEYASFFDLPYPIFRLKVKGYYGKAVQYCLHLTKWNARFNAKTGNFEISADFIGYTYALLSDMLLGYLRAIVETDAGYAKFLQAKSEMINENELVTINELLDKIVDVNEAVAKLSDTDTDVRELSKNKEITTSIESIESLLKDGMNGIKEPDSSSPEGYALLNGPNGLIGVRNIPQDAAQTKTNVQELENWKLAMKNQIAELNTNISPESQYLVTDFVGEKVPLYYENFTYDSIVDGNLETNPLQLDFRNAWDLLDENKYEDFIFVRMASIEKSPSLRKTNMTIYDFSKTIQSINDIKSQIGESELNLKENVGVKIRQTFIDLLGFEPTIGSIFRIFTVHAEIFLECLKEVSIKAEADVDGLRMAQVEGLRDAFDIHKSTSSSSGALPSKIYAWPLFRIPSKSANKSGALEEAYLGDTDNGGVAIPQNVPELVFVEQLLEGLLKVARDDAAREERINNPNTIVNSWFPINVLDTPLFGVKENPYKTDKIGNTGNPLDPLKLMMMRAFIFMGVSNRTLTDPEIIAMASLEANTCFDGVVNKITRNAMISSGEDDKTTSDKIIKYFKDGTNGAQNVSIQFGTDVYTKPRPLFSDFSDFYAYTYLSNKPSDGATGSTIFRTAISFNDDFNGSGFFKEVSPNIWNILSPNELYNKSYLNNPDDGLLFIEPNYRSYDAGSGEKFNDSGAMFMKIFFENEYDNEKQLLPNYVEQQDTLQEMISAVKNQDGVTRYLDSGTLYTFERGNESKEVIGFNIFGDDTSKFAFTTIKVVDITNIENNGGKAERAVPIVGSELPEMPLKALFYVNQNSAFGATSLSKPPKTKGQLEGDNITHKGSKDTINTIDFFNLRYNTTAAREYILFSNTNTNNPDLGKNRELFKSSDVYIPHVDFIVTTRGIISNAYSIYSLFGSQFYFEQRRSSSPKAAKALLFLHTLPWNQLYTDNTINDSQLAAIFDNDEGNTISNLFDRKSAFLNVPYLWCAFIGGMLWRYDNNPIIFNKDTKNLDPSGKIPSYLGGSGEFDPIVWGLRADPSVANSDIVRTTCVISDYVVSNSGDNIPNDYFPNKSQYLTSYKADGPLELDTNGEYKSIERTLKLLPSQIKKEFKRLFFDFVNSQEWINIRVNYELKLNDFDWDKPNIGTEPEYRTDGYVTPSVWSEGSIKWGEVWANAAILAPTGGLEYSPVDIDPYSNNVGPLDQGQYYISTNDYTVNTKTEVTRSGGFKGIKADIVTGFTNWVNYEYLQPIRFWPTATSHDIKDKAIDVKYNWDMSFRKNDRNTVLVELFKRGVWIANASYKSWTAPVVTATDGTVISEGAPVQEKYRDNFVISKGALELYVSSFAAEWKRLLKLNGEKKEEDELKQQLFNTMDNNTIRLNIYRHCKSVYDKWIAGSSGGVISACGSTDNKVDKELNKLKRKPSSPRRLIDSFRFVNRGFNDLSDSYLLNPSAIGDIVQGNMNQSFYDLISRVLSDNNFNFIALPSYIDFHSHEEMEALFKPNIFNDALNDDVSGPTFVCVYVGQSSNKLDLGETSNFPNDGFDFKCDKDGNLESGDGKLPRDFTNVKKDHEHNVIAFEVNYGHQNQNIFTDIRLDQQEFSETDESLQITDAIANNGSQSNRTQAGQNLWNVYQVRSYSTQIEAMGNAMIQPMMYFQLNNIPMFHGAYMIINAKHSIVPNYMKTTFKGVRTRFVDTPQIDSSDLYMSMLGTLSDVDGYSTTISSGGGTGGSGGLKGTSTGYAKEQGSFVSYNVTPNDGLEYQEKDPNGRGDSFAMKPVGQFMHALAIKWHEANKTGPTSDKLFINCFGAYGGGGNKSHSDNSLHYAGRAVDLRPMTINKDGMKQKSGTWNVGNSNYDREKNKEFMQMVIDMSDANTYGVKINNIILNDSELINYFSNVKNITGRRIVTEAIYHDDHIHMEFELPDAVAAAIAKGQSGIAKSQDGVTTEPVAASEEIVSDGVAGTVSKNKVSPLTKEQKLTHLGKI